MSKGSRRAAILSGLAAALALPAPAMAHGLVGRADLPIPQWLFAYAAVSVLVASFVALAVLWPKPRLQGDSWRPAGRPLGSALGARPLEEACQVVGALLLVLLVWAGLAGTRDDSANVAPTFVYVVFWVGLVFASVLFGDLFRAFNPWRAIGRGYGRLVRMLAGGRPFPVRPYPERFGYWPAVATIVAFATLELVASGGDSPRNVAAAALAYSALTFAAMAVYGVDAWLARGEGFSVYFNLFSRISVFERREGKLGLRPPLAGLARVEAAPGLVALVAVMIGTVSFDGFTSSSAWQEIVPHLREAFEGVGLSTARAFELALALGMATIAAATIGFYRLGVAGAQHAGVRAPASIRDGLRAHSVGGDLDAGRLAREFAHSLVPIAFAYVAAHYLSLLVFQGQAIVPLASDPLGRGWDLLGTAGGGIDYSVLSATAVWYLQVAFVVAGHVGALVLAHDRALALYPDSRLAIRSQYWMLGIMVGFTTLALWLLSQANAAG